MGCLPIKAGITKKGGTKKRDAVNNRLGRLDKQYGAIRKEYEVTFTYEGTGKGEKAVGMEWKRKEGCIAERSKFHGKYVLLTSLDETDELNIWKFYNVIRTVEETFYDKYIIMGSKMESIFDNQQVDGLLPTLTSHNNSSSQAS